MIVSSAECVMVIVGHGLPTNMITCHVVLVNDV